MSVRDVLVARHPGAGRGRGAAVADAAPAVPMPMVLTLDQIKPYERNPRRYRNEMYEELKESIRRRGLDVAIHVTRRPGEELYVVEAGGNTRLQILRELWEETRDERFYRIQVMYRPWRSELHVMAAHLVENDLRSGLCFADRARAVWELKREMERERGGEMSLVELRERLEEMGVSFSPAALSRMKFFVEFLAPLIPEEVREAIEPHIGPHHVQVLQSELAAVRKGVSEEDLEDAVRDAFAQVRVGAGGVQEALAELMRLVRARLAGSEAEDGCEGEPAVEVGARRCDEGEGADDGESAPDAAEVMEPAVEAPAAEAYADGDAGEAEAAEAEGGSSEEPAAPAPPVCAPLRSHPDARVRKLQEILDLRAAIAGVAVQVGGAAWDRWYGFRVTDDSPAWLCALAGEDAVALRALVEDDRVFPHVWRMMHWCRMVAVAARDLEGYGLGKRDEILAMESAELARLQEEADPELGREREMLRAYVRYGASNAMILSLFPGVRSQEITRLRIELGVSTNGGRPLKPLSYEVEQMRALWERHRDLPERERWLAVARGMEKSGVSLTTIWNTLQAELHRERERAA